MDISRRGFWASGFLFWVVLALVAGYWLYPLRSRLKLGIDLVGGTYITLGVQANKAVEHELYERLARVAKILKKNKKLQPVSQKVVDNTLVLAFANEQDAIEAHAELRDDVDDMVVAARGTTITCALPNERVKMIRREALESNIEVLRTRMNAIGVAEINIVAQGDDRIVVELPDVEDPRQAKEMIGTPAILEFKLVEAKGASYEDVLDKYDGDLPEGMHIIAGRERGDEKTYYLVPEHAEVSGRYLRNAYAGIGGSTGVNAVVNFELSPEGGRRFRELTGNNIGRELAIVLDNKVVSSATIRSEIERSGYIEGGFSRARTQEIATLLKSGAFVAPVTFEEERRIGPSLGEESRRNGLLSCLVGMGLLFVFSLFYYKISGLLAFIALVFNLLLILFGLSLLRATLTLPGIAGMVLTVGMAIDASILIYEKIKELLAAGVSTRAAVREGFSDAMVVILDANITTFIVGVVLFYFGTGPIKGFAATMMLGIVATLITGLFFLRSLFNAILDIKVLKKLSI